MVACFLCFIAIGTLLSLLKFAGFDDLEQFREISFNGPVTIKVGGDFDSRFYGNASVSITSLLVTQPAGFEASLCQVGSDGDTVTTIPPIDFDGEMDNSGDGRCYLRFPGFLSPRIPAVFMLSRSVIGFNFMPVMGTLLNLTVNLHVFINARECMQFNEMDGSVSPHETIKLTQRGNFTGTYESITDDYVCIVVELEREVPAYYEFNINATVLQYQNVSYLEEHSLCDKHISKTHHDPSTRMDISLELNRPFTSAVSVRPQSTCVLLTLEGALDASVLNATSTILATAVNVGTIPLSAVGSVAFIIASVISFILCVTCRISR